MQSKLKSWIWYSFSMS